MGRFRPGTVELVFEPNIRREVVQKTVELAFREHGCTECGMNGLDLLIRAQDPIIDRFKGLKGLMDVKVYR